MKVPSGYDCRHAFLTFLAISFGQNAFHLAPVAQPKEAEYATEVVKIALPSLDAPEAIRARTAQPRAETDALVASLSCLSDQPGCKVHLMIPFYSHSDPWVPVFRECSRCPHPKPMIIFVSFIEGHWWHSAMGFNDSPDFVDRTRSQIEKALMVEVTR
jgi:hypothetical protein